MNLMNFNDFQLISMNGWAQPGNRFRFRIRERVVRASEAVRDDIWYNGGSKTYLC